jgi:hypothetical protein
MVYILFESKTRIRRRHSILLFVMSLETLPTPFEAPIPLYHMGKEDSSSRGSVKPWQNSKDATLLISCCPSVTVLGGLRYNGDINMHFSDSPVLTNTWPWQVHHIRLFTQAKLDVHTQLSFLSLPKDIILVLFKHVWHNPGQKTHRSQQRLN